MSESSGRGVEHPYGRIDTEYGARMLAMSPEDDGPVFMVNFMHYKAEADYGEGGERGVSGREADDRYAPLDVLDRIGARVEFHGDVVAQSGPATPAWDRIGVVRYPTRRSFLKMQSRPDFRERHVHKAAGMEATFVIGSLPRDGTAPRATGHLVPGRIVAVSAYAAVNGTTPADIVAALGGSREAARAHGCDHGQWFDAEGTIMGDGRSFDVVCFDAFDSLGGWLAYRAALADDPECAVLVDAARCDSYAVAVEPVRDAITSR